MISCDHCKMVFKYNCHLEKHLSRKFPCFTNIPTELSMNNNLEKDKKYPMNVVKNHQMSSKNTQKDAQNTPEVDNSDVILLDKRVYLCDKCGKRYASKRDFKRHVESCNGLNVLQCPTCHKTFSHRAAKSRHIKNVKCTPVQLIEQPKNPNDKTLVNLCD